MSIKLLQATVEKLLQDVALVGVKVDALARERDVEEQPAPRAKKKAAPVADDVDPPTPAAAAEIPADVAEHSRDAYREGMTARANGEDEGACPYPGDRGIPGARRKAWLRAHAGK